MSASAVDFASVRREIGEAARRAFTLVRSKHPDERFYTFALCSDCDAQSVCGSANTEEGNRRCLERYAYRRAEDEAIVAKIGMTFADYANYYRWNLPEWAYHATETREFRALDPLIGDADEIESADPEGFDAFRAQLYGSMILALKELDDEGFFGSGAPREAIVLFCDLVDPPEKYWFALESAKILNPPSTYQSFASQWLAWQNKEGREIIADPAHHSPVYRPLRSFLADEGGVPGSG